MSTLEIQNYLLYFYETSYPFTWWQENRRTQRLGFGLQNNEWPCLNAFTHLKMQNLWEVLILLYHYNPVIIQYSFYSANITLLHSTFFDIN